jgi:hypothetical protein
MTRRQSERLCRVIDLSLQIVEAYDDISTCDIDFQDSSCEFDTNGNTNCQFPCLIDSSVPSPALEHHRRCLFSEYWAKTVDRSYGSSNDKTNKVSIIKNEMDSPQTMRRTLFEKRYDFSQLSDISVVSLQESSTSCSLESLASFSDTEEKSIKSCLRKSRFSITKNPLTHKTLAPTSSVRFSSEVKTRLFHEPMERWSCDSWSEYFR